MTVQDILCDIMRNEGVNQNEMAKKLNISRQAMSQILHGKGDIKMSTVISILDELGYVFRIEKVGEDDE